MLVITRKEGERIVIDDDIVITVVESKRGSVRLGEDRNPSPATGGDRTRGMSVDWIRATIDAVHMR